MDLLTGLTPARIGVVFDAGGITVAVLGTPIDKIYPVGNTGLANRILEKGAIISEYPAGHETRAYHFLERNRIVVKLADAVVVVEASDHSGTLRTASCALSEGVHLFAVPGDISRPMSVGCNNILKGPACSYVGFEDFLQDAFHMCPKVRKRHRLSSQEKSIVEQIQGGTTSGEQIVQNLNLSTTTFNQLITLLEMKGVVKALVGGVYHLLA